MTLWHFDRRARRKPKGGPGLKPTRLLLGNSHGIPQDLYKIRHAAVHAEPAKQMYEMSENHARNHDFRRPRTPKDVVVQKLDFSKNRNARGPPNSRFLPILFHRDPARFPIFYVWRPREASEILRKPSRKRWMGRTRSSQLSSVQFYLSPPRGGQNRFPT